MVWRYFGRRIVRIADLYKSYRKLHGIPNIGIMYKKRKIFRNVVSLEQTLIFRSETNHLIPPPIHVRMKMIRERSLVTSLFFFWNRMKTQREEKLWCSDNLTKRKEWFCRISGELSKYVSPRHTPNPSTLRTFPYQKSMSCLADKILISVTSSG